MAVTAGLVFTILLTVSGGSFQFYSFAVLNAPQTIVENWMNTTYYNRNGVGLTESSLTLLWSFTIASISIGAFTGSLATRVLSETCGRRNGLIANGVLNVFGGATVAISKGTRSPELLILGRLILGINMGLSSGLVPMYLTEIAPIRYRGAAGTTHQIAVAFGDWFSLCLSLPQIFGSVDLWPLAVAFPAIPALILSVCLPFCHESPRYLLLSRGDRDGAYKAIQFFVGKAEADGVFDDLVKEAAISSMTKQNVKLSLLFTKKSLRLPLLISLLVMVAQQFTGCAAIFAYSSEMFVQANLSLDVARLCTLGIGIAYFLFTLPSPYLIERAGRRSLSLFQLSGCLVCLVLLTLFVGLQKSYHWEWTSYASIVALVLYMCIYGVGSPIPWMITSELFAQEYRSSAVAMSTFTAWLFAFFISVAYLPFAEAVGTTLSFLPFIVILTLSIGGMAVLLPETKNKSIEEIVSEFRARSRTLSRSVTFHQLQKGKGTFSAAPELDALLEEEEVGSGGSSRTNSEGKYGSFS